MATIRPDELRKLMNDLSYASIKLVTRCLIEWQLHTMTRPSESAKVPITPQTIEILARSPFANINNHRT